MKNLAMLLEALNDYQKKYVDEKLGGKEYDPSKFHTEMFGSYSDKIHPNRLYFTASYVNKKLDNEVMKHLFKNGYEIEDGNIDTVKKPMVDKFGNKKYQYINIAKAIKRTGGEHIHSNTHLNREGQPMSILDIYTSQKNSDKESKVVISRDKEDLAGISTNRHWQSCMKLPSHECDRGGQNHGYIEEDMKHGTMAAYVINKGDDDIESPLGRFLIKKYTNKKGHSVYRAVTPSYGNVEDIHYSKINEILKKHYPANLNEHYYLDENVYPEGQPNFEEKRGVYRNGSSRIEHYNENSELHDYMDENGIHQPAIKIGNNSYYYKNGIRHRDGDEPASISKHYDYTEYAHFKEDMAHREGDKPSYYKIDNNSGVVLKELHRKYDIPHRLNQYADITRNELGIPISQKSYHYGLLHSYNNKPSMVENRNGVNIEEQYHINGKLSRDGDEPAHIKRYDNGELRMVHYYKNDELHRDGDEPAVYVKKYPTEEYYDDDSGEHYDRPIYDKGYTVIKRRYRNDVCYHENLPAYEEYEHDKDGKIVSSEMQFHNNEGNIHRDNDEPASSYVTNTIQRHSYYQNGNLHRGENKPANVSTTLKNNRTIHTAEWYNNGSRSSSSEGYHSIEDEQYNDGSRHITKKYINSPDRLNEKIEIYDKNGNKQTINNYDSHRRTDGLKKTYEDKDGRYEEYERIHNKVGKIFYDKNNKIIFYKDIFNNDLKYNSDGSIDINGVGKITNENGNLHVKSEDGKDYNLTSDKLERADLNKLKLNMTNYIIPSNGNLELEGVNDRHMELLNNLIKYTKGSD